MTSPPVPSADIGGSASPDGGAAARVEPGRARGALDR